MLIIRPMKIPVCVTCETPLAKKHNYLAFRCMCDEDVRTLHLEIDCENHSHIKYLFVLDNKQVTEYEQHCKQSNSIEIKPVVETGWGRLSV